MSIPTIEEKFPHLVRLKHHGKTQEVSLAIMTWLESHDIMIHRDFYLDMQDDPDRVLVHFRSKKNAKRYKSVKKDIRNGTAS